MASLVERVDNYFKEHNCEAFFEEGEELYIYLVKVEFDTFTNVVQIAIEKKADDKGLRIVSFNMNFDQGYVLSSELLKALNEFTINSLFFSASITPNNVIMVSSCQLVEEENITTVIDEVMMQLISDPNNVLFNLNKILNYEFDLED